MTPALMSTPVTWKAREHLACTAQGTVRKVGMPKKPAATEIELMAGLRLKAVREALGMTQEQFASRIGASRTQLANWEGGKIPDPRAMVRLFAMFQVSPDWIYAGLIRSLPYGIAKEIECIALRLGATVGAPESDWNPGSGAHQARSASSGRTRRGTIHEPGAARLGEA